MTHIRQQVRDAAITAVTGLTVGATTVQVYGSRAVPVQSAKLPALLVYTAQDQVAYVTMTPPRTRTHDIQLIVEVLVQGVDGCDDTLDSLAEAIETQVLTDITLGGIARDVQVTNTATSFLAESEYVLAIAAINFSVDVVDTE